MWRGAGDVRAEYYYILRFHNIAFRFRRDTELYIDGITLYSQEGTTQGDPLAMSMYALAVLPLIKEVNPEKSVIQSWYTDDALAAVSVSSLREWWDALVTLGPRYLLCQSHQNIPNRKRTPSVHRQHPQHPLRTRKLKLLMMANHTAAALGTSSFTKLYVKSKVEKLSEELNTLASIAETNPQAAHACFSHGFVSKWTYLTRTIENIGPLLQPLEDTIREKASTSPLWKACPE